jgi:hypothetical protein
MSHFNDRPGTKLTIAVVITLVVVAAMITDKGWLAVAPLAAQHYSVEMYTLFVGLLLVGMLLGWALLSGFSIARSIHKTRDVLVHRGDSNEAVDSPCPDERAEDVPPAKTPWDNLLRIEQIEAEQKEPHPRGAAKLADQFQAAVGTLIGMGSPGLAEREPSARIPSETAESSQPLAGVAASRSEAPRSDCSVQTVSEKGDGIASPAPRASNIACEMMMQATGHVDDALMSIPAIAERINPPALAAVIAAARAGEAGKGFAAIARELSVLAAQTAKVLEQLSIQIGKTEATTHDPSSASRTPRQASNAPERAHRRAQPQWKSRTRDAGRPSPRPRRRRSGLT